MGASHPCLGGLNVKAGFLHSWLGWRAGQSHLVIHVGVIHVTCISCISIAAIVLYHLHLLCIFSTVQPRASRGLTQNCKGCRCCTNRLRLSNTGIGLKRSEELER